MRDVGKRVDERRVLGGWQGDVGYGDPHTRYVWPSFAPSSTRPFRDVEISYMALKESRSCKSLIAEMQHDRPIPDRHIQNHVTCTIGQL